MQENNSSTVEFKNHLLINQTTGECYETNIEIKKIYNLSTKAKGYRMIYMKDGGELESCLVENCHPKLVLSICRDISKDGVLKFTQKHYADKLNVTERSIQNHWVLLKKHKIIKQVKKVTYVNPYVALPYNVKDEDANRIQQHWDSLWYDEV